MAFRAGQGIVPLVITNVRGDKVSLPGGCHRLLRPVFKFALQRAGKVSGYVIRDGMSWGYAYRVIAGTNTLSTHAFGIAVDINAPFNGRGGRGNIPMKFVRVMRRWGFEWGGDWDYTDPMHFEWRFGWRRARKTAREARRKRTR